jgi:hypothetical protein
MMITIVRNMTVLLGWPYGFDEKNEAVAADDLYARAG